MILDNVNSPMDVRKLSINKLKFLAIELREFLIKTVCETGGHLASNLGVVELTIALHYTFNTPIDKIVWDVGHQTYIHKILTGRKDKLDTIRKINGLSGFPKRKESSHDVFNAGHSSTSISAALGIAKSRDLKNEKYHVLAVIGDGALTGGMAFEALNDAGRSNNNLIVILNDNEMSIDENVGGLSKYLNKIRTQPIYYKAKEDVEFVINRIPAIGKGMAKTIHKAKDSIKYMLLAGMFFEELGFKYYGPVDGHDINSLVEVLSKAKLMEGPVLIHVCTKKGKGYNHAENKPDTFHGISSFNRETGKPYVKKTSFSNAFGDKLCQIAKTNSNLVAVTAAMISGTGLSNFYKMYPKRLFDVGIAEQHAITFSAGMAVNGLIPVAAIYSSFLQRAYDQIIHDVAMQNLHVVIAIDRAGLVGEDGETHQGIYDISFLNHIPNMTIMAPCDYNELEKMLDYAINIHNGPIAIRYPRGEQPDVLSMDYSEIQLGKSVIVREGKDLTIIASGRMLYNAIQTSNMLEKEGIECEVINLRFLKPLDTDVILKSGIKTKKVLIIEEGIEIGSVASTIKIMYTDNGYHDVKVAIRAFPDEFITQGKVSELFEIYGFDIEGLYTLSKQLLTGEGELTEYEG